MSKEKYSKSLLNSIVSRARSIREILGILGLKLSGSNYSYMKKLFVKHGVDTSHFTGMASNRGKGHKGGFKKKTWQEISVKRENGTRESAQRLRRALIESGRTFKCSEEKCPVENLWLSKPITLNVDHINGDFTDCRLDNLRFLCPNCHSQTTTFGSGNRTIGKTPVKKSYKKADKLKKFCIKCNEELFSRSKVNLCKKCMKQLPLINRRTIKYPAREELSILIGQEPLTSIGKKLGVSGNAVKKRARKLGIDLPNRLGYWTKRKNKPDREELNSKLLDYTTKEIATFYGVDKSTVRKWLRFYNLEITSTSFRALRQWKRKRLQKT
jgi:hypothetical protein